MNVIKVSDISIINRQRRHFDEAALAKLADSIRTKGLLHPIVLQGDGKTLVAGERRTRAVQLLADLDIGYTCGGQSIPAGSVPFISIRELSETDLVEAELEENVLREDLTWQEEADAIARLHELRTGQKPGQTYGATAEEIAGRTPTSSERDKVRNSIIIKEHLADPDVAKAKSQKEALKIITKKKQAALTAQLAEQFDIEQTPHILNQGDFRDFTHFISTGSVDVICTDPPYGIGADDFGDQAGATHGYDDSPEYFREILNAFFTEANRVTKERAHAYVFCDPRQLEFIRQGFEVHGWSVWPVPLIWDKGNGMLPEPDFGPRRCYETIIYANKGRKPITAVYSDVISVAGLQAPRFGAEKPAELYENLLRRSVRPGDLVWDAFVGAGPIFPAANRLNARVVGTELIEEKYNYAKLRMKEE